LAGPLVGGLTRDEEKWFVKRGRIERDIILDLEDCKGVAESEGVVEYRIATQGDMEALLTMVDCTTKKTAKMVWFDQYSSVWGQTDDVVIGVEDGKIIAAALRYTPSCGSKIAAKLPYDVGM
jgi:hypothetical protein